MNFVNDTTISLVAKILTSNAVFIISWNFIMNDSYNAAFTFEKYFHEKTCYLSETVQNICFYNSYHVTNDYMVLRNEVLKLQ